VIMIENVTAIACHQKVREAVSIVVSDSDAHAEVSAGHAGGQRDIRKAPIPIVLVEGVPGRILGIVKVACAAVHQVDVQPAVVIKVEEGAARPDNFRRVVPAGPSIVMHARDATSLSSYNSEQADR